MNKYVLYSMVAAAMSGAPSLLANVILVDRGLPTANLNNAAGANRSNVAWGSSGYTPSDYWITGDTFTNTSAQSWTIDTIRLWSVGPTATAQLLGGIDGTALGFVANGVITNATYAGGLNYQGFGGSTQFLHQIDFGVNIVLAPGQTFDFFLDGSGAADPDVHVPLVHASNAARSGSTQAGANNTMLYANIYLGTFDAVYTWDSLGDGWDKSSDVNVQVFGAAIGGAVPESGATVGLLGVALLGLATLRRRLEA